MTLIRISITIARDLVKAMDRRARELDRSRSWVIGDAARRYLEGPGVTDSAPSAATAAVRESQAPYGISPGLGPSRLAQLHADLALTPTERVRAAERTARAVPRGTRRVADRILTFDRYEDYLDWKRREGLL